MSVTEAEVRAKPPRHVGESLGVDWGAVAPETFRHALATELEHAGVTKGDLALMGRRVPARMKAETQTWAAHMKPGRSLLTPTLGGGCGTRLAFAALVFLIVVLVAYLGWRRWKGKEGLLIARDALGYRLPVRDPRVPNPDYALLRSRPYPPGRYPVGGVADYYTQWDPAYATVFEGDLCWHVPIACSGLALDEGLP